MAKRRRIETMNLQEAQETALKAFSEFVANKRLEWEVAGHSKGDWDNLLWEFVGKAVLELPDVTTHQGRKIDGKWVTTTERYERRTKERDTGQFGALEIDWPPEGEKQ